MAETFKNQVDALTGFGSTEDTALSDWLTAGAKELIHVFPPALLEKCKDFSTLDTSPNSLTNIDTRGHVFSVIRSDGSVNQIASYIDSKFNGQVTDSTSLYFATVGAPKYTIYGTNLYVYPTPSDAQPAYIEHVQFPTVAHGDSSITKFPDEAEYLVTLYASIKALQRLMNTMKSSIPVHSDQDGSYSAISSLNQGWENVRYWLENEEDTEMSGGTISALSNQMQQFVSEYQWYQSQQTKLQQDYDKGVQILIGGTK